MSKPYFPNLVTQLIDASELPFFHNEDGEPRAPDREELEKLEALLMEAVHAIWRMGLHESVMWKLARASALGFQLGQILHVSECHVELTENELACLTTVVNGMNFYSEEA